MNLPHPGPHHAGLEGPLSVISMQWCRQPIYLMAISNRHEIGFTSTVYSFESICGPQAGISAYEDKWFQTKIWISVTTMLNSSLLNIFFHVTHMIFHLEIVFLLGEPRFRPIGLRYLKLSVKEMFSPNSQHLKAKDSWLISSRNYKTVCNSIQGVAFNCVSYVATNEMERWP
jgi:hypothetical protein